MKKITIGTTAEAISNFKAQAKAEGLTNGQYFEQLVNAGATAEKPANLPRFTSTIVFNRQLQHPEVFAKDEAAAKKEILKMYPGATIHQVKTV